MIFHTHEFDGPHFGGGDRPNRTEFLKKIRAGLAKAESLNAAAARLFGLHKPAQQRYFRK